MKIINCYFTFGMISFLLIYSACKQNSSANLEDIPQQQKQEIKKIGKTATMRFPTININENDKLISPATIKVNSQGIWFANEGELGRAQLVDETGMELALGILTTEENWMTNQPVEFSTELIFSASKSKYGILIIHNHPGDGSGDEAGEKINFEIPITF